MINVGFFKLYVAAACSFMIPSIPYAVQIL